MKTLSRSFLPVILVLGCGHAEKADVTGVSVDLVVDAPFVDALSGFAERTEGDLRLAEGFREVKRAEEATVAWADPESARWLEAAHRLQRRSNWSSLACKQSLEVLCRHEPQYVIGGHCRQFLWTDDRHIRPSIPPELGGGVFSPRYFASQ